MKLAEYHKTVKAAKPAKYRSKITVVNGIKFRSKKESVRYKQLLLLVACGEVRELRLQVRYDLHAIGGEKITRYDADFCYLDRQGRLVVEDAKGARKGQGWDLYVLKRKWMKAEYGIEIVEV